MCRAEVCGRGGTGDRYDKVEYGIDLGRGEQNLPFYSYPMASRDMHGSI